MSKTKHCKIQFGKDGKLTKKGELCYAKNIFTDNPIHKNEVKRYSGKALGTGVKSNPHGISKSVWKKAFSWAKKTGNLTITDRYD